MCYTPNKDRRALHNQGALGLRDIVFAMQSLQLFFVVVLKLLECPNTMVGLLVHFKEVTDGLKVITLSPPNVFLSSVRKAF